MLFVEGVRTIPSEMGHVNWVQSFRFEEQEMIQVESLLILNECPVQDKDPRSLLSLASLA